MTAADYKSAGFAVSANLEQAKIDTAETLVTGAYLSPIIGTSTLTAPTLLVEALAFLYLLRQNAFMTRSGAKLKTWQNSEVLQEWAAVSQMCTTCAYLLQDFRDTAVGVAGANANADVTDICKIYFKSNYFGL